MKIIKVSIIIVFLLPFMLLQPLRSDVSFPLSYSVKTMEEGGKVICAGHERYYFVKTKWMLEDKTIYSWKGIGRQNTKAIGIDAGYVVDAFCNGKDLYLLAVNNKTITILIYDENLSIKGNILVDTTTTLNTFRYSVPNTTSNYFIDSNKNHLYLQYGRKLYSISLDSKQNAEMIANNVVAITNNDKRIYYLKDIRSGCQLFFVSNNKSHFITDFPLTDRTQIFASSKTIIVTNSVANSKTTLISAFDIADNYMFASEWINTTSNLLDVDTAGNIYFVTSEKEQLYAVEIDIQSINKKEQWKRKNITNSFISPFKLKWLDGSIYVFFENGMISLSNTLSWLSQDAFDFSNVSKLKENLQLVSCGRFLMLRNNNLAILFSQEQNRFWYVSKIILVTYKYAIPLALILLCLYIFMRYRRQRILLNAIVNINSMGFVFFVSRYGKLLKLNEGGKQILDIPDNLGKHKQFSYYCTSDWSKILLELVERGLQNRTTFQQRINFIIDNVPQEWLCTISPLRNIAGRFNGLLMTGVNITQELERQMMTNWAQLAHDMQTNLSTIRLNTEQMSSNTADEQNRKQKILHQIAILSNRIQDILTVGRSDELDKKPINSLTFCTELRNEFDDNLFSNIHFEIDVDNFQFIGDEAKLHRAVRNAVENAMKYMKQNGGTITIGCHKDIRYTYISVRDTGIGMDENTKNKIFKPFFSTIRKKGGNGIGTMIMQRVIELHGGKLQIESKLGVGTEIIFCIPNLSLSK